MKKNSLLPRFVRTLVALGVITSCPGCFVIADLDGYRSINELGCDVELGVQAFSPHLSDTVYWDIVRDEGGVLAARTMVDPLVDANRRVLMPNAVPQGLHRLELWADVDGSGVVETAPIDGGRDHSWLFPDACNIASVCDGASEPELCFAHVGQFDVLDPPLFEGNDFDITMSGLSVNTSMLEVHLVLVDSELEQRRVVGVYRTDRLEGATTKNVVIEGLVLTDARYTIDVLVDLDGNGTIDPNSEVWTLPEASGTDYSTPLSVDVTTEDPAGALPVEGILVSNLL